MYLQIVHILFFQADSAGYNNSIFQYTLIRQNKVFESLFIEE